MSMLLIPLKRIVSAFTTIITRLFSRLVKFFASTIPSGHRFRHHSRALPPPSSVSPQARRRRIISIDNRHPQKSTTMPSLSEKSLREKFDRMHAESIRRGMVGSSTTNFDRHPVETTTSSRPRQPLPSIQTSSVPSVDIKSINDALANLDRAEQLRDDGEYSKAMTVYESSIGELIQHLRTIPQKTRAGEHNSIDRSVLAERVKVALTDAEQLKAKLSERKTCDTTTNSSTKNETKAKIRGGSLSPSNSASAITSSFYSALGIGKSRSYESSGNNGKQHQKKSATALLKERKKQNNSDNASTLSNSAPTASKDSTINAPHQSQQQQYQRPQQYQQQQQLQPRKKKSNLDYNNNPLVTTIKTELYVDRSQMKTQWDDVVGLESAKRSLQEAVILPMIRPDLYTGLRCPPRGICLYGPPGTGKTMLVRAAAHESQCILFACTASALTSKWHGEGEKLLRTLFAVASDAAPSILFFDEIDALLSSRQGGGNEHEASRRFKTEFMVQMDGIISGNNDDDDLNQRLLVIGCTNCPWDLDDAVMRRFQRRIYVPLPDKAARKYLLMKLLDKESGRHSLSSSQIEKIVERTEGYSCSDINSMCQDAAFCPLREMGGINAIRDCNANDVRLINARDFEESMKYTKRSVSNQLLDRYRVWEDQQSARK